jgi:inhibitor of KinA
MAMTGIYTLDSPGGWHLLGQTPIPLFDSRQNPPSLLRPGDSVTFQPVAADTFLQLAEAGATGRWPALQEPL